MTRMTMIGLLALAQASCVVSTNHCVDGIIDGSETDVDCGGVVCGACGVGRACAVPSDCTTGLCVNNVCSAPSGSSCTDFVQNGSETDIDCGGGACPTCGVGRLCSSPTDCASGSCMNNRCVDPNFTPVDPADVYHIDGGAGVTVAPGTLAGFGITAAASGLSFRLVWTGDGNATSQYHEFYGSVSTSGTFVSVTPGCNGQCNTGNDYISSSYPVQGGQRVDFDASSVNTLDGFDFVVDTEPVVFDLYIDGTHVTSNVFFVSGGVQTGPQVIPFGLTTQ